MSTYYPAHSAQPDTVHWPPCRLDEDVVEAAAEDKHPGRHRWLGWSLAAIAAAVLLVVALWACIAVLPGRLYPPLTNQDLAGLTAAERAQRIEGRQKLQNDARTTLLQGLAALLVLAGAGLGATVTLRQVRTSREGLEDARKRAEGEAQQAREQLGVAHKQLEATERQAREQLEVARNQLYEAERQAREQLALAQQGQITERFTRAIDQLGSQNLEVRLGGISALGRIARDSEEDRGAIAAILAAYIRGRSPWPPSQPGQYRADAPLDRQPELWTRAPDVQAALAVLGGGQFTHERLVDLHGTDLRCADLRDAHLEKSYLREVHLEKAKLHHTHLEEANLRGAHLEEADLYRAHAAGANLSFAHLDGAECVRADFSKTNLFYAHLAKANFAGVILAGASANEDMNWPGGIDPKARGVVLGGPWGPLSP